MSSRLSYAIYHQYIFISSTWGFFSQMCLLCIRVLFYGFVPKIIFFLCWKTKGYIGLVFFFLIPNAIQNFYRSSKKSKFWLPNTFHLLQETVNNESYSPQNLPYILEFNGPCSSFIYTYTPLVFLSLQNSNDPFISES